MNSWVKAITCQMFNIPLMKYIKHLYVSYGWQKTKLFKMSKAILIAYQYTEQVSLNNEIKSMKVKQQSGEKVLHFVMWSWSRYLWIKENDTAVPCFLWAMWKSKSYRNYTKERKESKHIVRENMWSKDKHERTRSRKYLQTSSKQLTNQWR